MGKRKSGSQRWRALRWLRHRYLLTIEALLLLDCLLRAFEQLLVASELPGWAIVALAMLVVVGVFGSLLLLLERLAKGGVGTVHKMAKGVPLPFALLLVHLLILAGCAWVVAWDLDVLERLWG